MTRKKAEKPLKRASGWYVGEKAIKKWFRFRRYFKGGPVIQEALFLTNYSRLLVDATGKMGEILVCTDLDKWARSRKWDEVPLTMTDKDYLKEWEKSQKKATKAANTLA